MAGISDNYAWDYAVAVELTGDRAPKIEDVTGLLTTVSTDAQTVSATITDDNPGGGNAGVASAELMYTTDGTTFMSVAMTADGDVWSGDIPGQQPGTNISYYLMATDVEGLTTETAQFSYGIFEVVNTNLLVIFNGGTEGRAQLISWSLLSFRLQLQILTFGLLTDQLVNSLTNMMQY